MRAPEEANSGTGSGVVAARAAGGGCAQWYSDRLGCQHGEALVQSTAAQLARLEGLFVWNPGFPTAK